ncbi:MAG: exosortase-associated EpsI family protein [Sedimentisphaerales bacterium]|nr:exosortase-associated EpsI family protein [Sedimentisphaerales bacterium]
MFRKKPSFRLYLFASILLVGFGIVYRLIGDVGSGRIELPVPLREMPMDVGDWEGEDWPLSEVILNVADNDDYVSRFYVNNDSGLSASLYVAYTARPRTMLGHRPTICYVGAGWAHDKTVPDEFVTSSGRRVPCLIHNFHRPMQSGEVVVMNFYIANGKLTNDEGTISGLGWRTPNISGDIARYVAQVQIASVREVAVRELAAVVTEEILRYLPDENAEIAAAKDVTPSQIATDQVEP